MDLESAYKILGELQKTIEKFETYSSDFPSELVADDWENADDVYRADRGMEIIEHLRAVKHTLDWVNAPVKAEGLLNKGGNGRYSVGGYELSSGSPLDFYHEDSQTWQHSRIEHNGSDYYIVALGRTYPIHGIQARIRRDW